ncbi:TolC family protein [Rapidithrix thailandica]|uniref:TolC family protein n=1 Tax=Rapidithrix thailandica TaxID=413964 RepID=A0AAW9S7Q2_9BACT
MKHSILIIGFILLLSAHSQADTLSLHYCHEQAILKSPEQQQLTWLESLKALQVSNLRLQNLPQWQVILQATYQSDAVTFNPGIPMMEGIEVPKDQYRGELSLQQKLFDGGKLKSEIVTQELNIQTQQQQVQVNLYQIKEVINRLYFSALILQENEKLLRASVLKELENRLASIRSKVANGVLLKSNANGLEIEILKVKQQITQISYEKQSMLKMLAKWTEDPKVPEATLTLPEVALSSTEIKPNSLRPEYQLFALQQQYLESKKKRMTLQKMPDLHVFGTLGIGQPNPLNFFETEFEPYYLVGLRLTWQPVSYGRWNREQESLSLQQQIVLSEQENFDKQLTISLTQEHEELQKLKALILSEKQMISLQKEQVNTSASQLANGVITSTGYITELNRQTAFQLQLQIHEIQQVQTLVNQLTKQGKF